MNYFDYFELLCAPLAKKRLLIRLSIGAKWVKKSLFKFCEAFDINATIIVDDARCMYKQQKEYDFYIYFISERSEKTQEISTLFRNRKCIEWKYPIESLIKKNQWQIVYLPPRNDFLECPFMSMTKADYAALSRRCVPLFAKFRNGSKIKVINKYTDISFTYSKTNVFSCFAQNNLPDGEIGVVPDLHSTNGSLYFRRVNYHDISFHDIYLYFEEGRCVEFYCDKYENFQKLLSYDTLASFIGEFAFGLNPLISQKRQVSIVDEKILGTYHFALGGQDINRGIKSYIHIDMISDCDDAYSVYIDDELIVQNGEFVGKTLRSLNNSLNYYKLLRVSEY